MSKKITKKADRVIDSVGINYSSAHLDTGVIKQVKPRSRVFQMGHKSLV